MRHHPGTADALIEALDYAIRSVVPVGIAPEVLVRSDPRVPVGTVRIMIAVNGPAGGYIEPEALAEIEGRVAEALKAGAACCPDERGHDTEGGSFCVYCGSVL